MIIEYHRPNNLQDALALLTRPEPLTRPLAGGSVISQPSTQAFAVVDLQALGLDDIQQSGNFLELGATLTLQGLVNFIEAAGSTNPAWSTVFLKAVGHEATYNLRQVASVAGTLVVADGRSPFATLMLALDATLTLQPGDEQVGLGDLLPLRSERLAGRLITQVAIPSNVRLAYEYVARTPADVPIVCTVVSLWPSGRTRLALGGYGDAPILAFDGTESEGLEIAARNAYSQAGDEWASAAYRQDVAGILAARCLENL